MKKVAVIFLIGMMVGGLPALLSAEGAVNEAFSALLNRGWDFRSAVLQERVDLPHCWNRDDTLSGAGVPYFRGEGIYTKELRLQPQPGRRYFICFNGANQLTRFWINDKAVGSHRGGYTAFVFEITDFIREGCNRLRVSVDNRYNPDIMPHVGDFNMYGGLYRPLEWMETGAVAFVRTDCATEGAVVQTHVNDDRTVGTVKVRTALSFSGPSADLLRSGAEGLSLRLRLIDAGGGFAVEALVPVSDFPPSAFRSTLPADKAAAAERAAGTAAETQAGKAAAVGLPAEAAVAATATATAEADPEADSFCYSLSVPHPHLWDGIADPFLYRLTLTLCQEGVAVPLDSLSFSIGFKQVRIDPAKGFFLNGHPYKIHGVCRHQDFKGVGNALLPAHHQRDFELMAEMGVNAVRLAHYPQAQAVYSLADRYGMLVWAEIPFVGGGGYPGSGYSPSSAFRRQAVSQLTELIQQNSHHVSVFTWGLFNELKKEGTGPLPLVESLNRLAHRLDPTRPTTAATNGRFDFNAVTDLIAFNKYYGCYGGVPKQIASWADRTAKTLSQPLGISEYGVGGAPGCFSDSFPCWNPPPCFHPENEQAAFHENYWKYLVSRDFLWGTFVWNMFDFGACHRNEGACPNLNDKGLVSFDRAVKKEAFYFYQANWSDRPMVHLCEKGRLRQPKARLRFRLYSNVKQVALTLNGADIPLQSKGLHILESVWKHSLKKGENVLIATATLPNGETIRDTAIWKH